MLVILQQFVLSLRLIKLSPIYAKTVVETWSELHATRLISHDFSPMLEDSSSENYVGLVRGSMVRAVASFKEISPHSITVECVANHPSDMGAASELVNLMVNNNVTNVTKWPSVRKQPRVHLEYLLSL